VITFLRAYREYDPASRSLFEIFFLYPGVKAIAFHRVAHGLHRMGVPFFPRMISEIARFLTGIEIHPGATLGRNVIIDHGMGIVIGETAEVGDGVVLYQGVTLGGTSLQRVKRHPTLEARVVVGAGAKVIGNIRIGEGAKVGANSVVTENVEAGATVAGVPARVLAKKN
jgi:serine O-acetyltransferase